MNELSSVDGVTILDTTSVPAVAGVEARIRIAGITVAKSAPEASLSDAK